MNKILDLLWKPEKMASEITSAYWLDLPTVEHENGDKEWRLNGKLHRLFDRPAKEFLNGDKEWWFDGQRHRGFDKPAIEYGHGGKEWFVFGKRHRAHDRPSIICRGGYKAWFLNDIEITLFRNKYVEARKMRAQKKIYFCIIHWLYRPGSESAKRLSESSWSELKKMI